MFLSAVTFYFGLLSVIQLVIIFKQGQTACIKFLVAENNTRTLIGTAKRWPWPLNRDDRLIGV